MTEHTIYASFIEQKISKIPSTQLRTTCAAHAYAFGTVSNLSTTHSHYRLRFSHPNPLKTHHDNSSSASRSSK